MCGRLKKLNQSIETSQAIESISVWNVLQLAKMIWLQSLSTALLSKIKVWRLKVLATVSYVDFVNDNRLEVSENT